MRWLDSLLRRGSRTQLPQAPLPAGAPAGMDYLLGRTAAAEAPAADRAPGPDPDALCRQADAAQDRGDWSEAERLWSELRRQFPDFFPGFTGGAVALAHLGRYSVSCQVIDDAAARMPHERALPLEGARLAMRQQDWPRAEAMWRKALAFDVKPWWVYSELANALEFQGRIQEAEAVLFQARTECDEPNEITLYAYPARLAWQREDWAEAVARWSEAVRRFPGNLELPARLHEAMMRLGEHDPSAYEAALRANGTTDDRRALVLRFESFGGTGPEGGCEFGCFQRACGAEPLALFRWATVPVDSLINALEQRFAGFGQEAAITIEPHEGQWEITDTAFGTKMHSFVACAETSREQMAATAGRRMRYLKEKLIADLEKPEKIFVLKSAWAGVTPEQANKLGDAMRSYGPAVLLCVCAADPDHPNGTLERAGPNLFMGHIDFSVSPSALRRPMWDRLCRLAAETIPVGGLTIPAIAK